jgi:hypothetical protein
MRKMSSVVEPFQGLEASSMKIRRDKTRNRSLFKKLKDSVHWIVIGRNIDAERFIMGQILVENQTEYHNHEDRGNLFYTLLHEDFEAFRSHCLGTATTLTTHDPVGASVFHIAYLYGIYPIGRWLVENYSSECLGKYDTPENYTDDEDFLPYTGENILHMVIMQRELEEADFILKTYEKKGEVYLHNLLCAEAIGHFFQPGGDTGKYLGAYPLLFAVCSNGTKMVDKILEYAHKIMKSPFKKFVDEHGNNAMHMCVLYNLQDMMDHIFGLLGPAANELMVQENMQGFSPFTLAAVEKKEMFEFLLAKRKEKLWSYGPVTRFKIDLEGLDCPHRANMTQEVLEKSAKTIYQEESKRGSLVRISSVLNAYNPLNRVNKGRNYSALEFICIKNKLEMFEIPIIKQIIETKWERIGYPQFKYRFLFYIFVTALLLLIVCLIQNQYGDSFLPWFTWCLFLTLFLILLYKFLNEVAEMKSLGIAYWGFGADLGVRGAAQLDNLCSTLEFVTFSTACFLKVLQYLNVVSHAGTEGVILVLLAITVLTSWIYLYFFLLGFEITGVFVVIVADILTSDLPKFMSLFGIVLFGFGSSFALLHGADESGFVAGLHNLIDYIWTLFVYTITAGNEGVHYFPYSYGKSPRWFYVGMVMLYNLCIVFLMLNLLIAMMSKTYEDLQKTSHLIVLREKYNIMCSFERTHTPHQNTKFRKKYAMTTKDVLGRFSFYFQLEETDDTWLTTGNLSDTNKKVD